MTVENPSTIDETPAGPPGRWVEGLSADMSRLDALETIFRQRWEGALYFVPRAADQPDDVEHVHKLRVSCRRLTAVLDVLAEGFPAAPRQRLLKLARKIRRRCGTARDLDVRRRFLETLLPHASVEDAAVVELLCEGAEARRAAEQNKLRRRLPRLERRLRRRGLDLLEGFEKLKQRSPRDRASFGQSGARTLQSEMAALWSRAETDLAAGESLHQLRIACKHLRYAFEVFLPMLPGTFREDYYPQLEHIQDLLGEIHDSTQATRALRRQRKKWKRARHTAKWAHSGLASFNWRTLRAGLDAVVLAYAQQADQARTEFLDLWPGFAGDSFRIPVEEALAALAEETAAVDRRPLQSDAEPETPPADPIPAVSAASIDGDSSPPAAGGER